jgi:hypothetical protein
LFDELAERVGHCFGGERVAVLAGEHQAVVDVCSSPRGALGVLAQPLFEQHTDSALTEVHSPRIPARCFGWPELDAEVRLSAHGAWRRLPGDVDELLANYEVSVLEIHVHPAQPASFAAP